MFGAGFWWQLYWGEMHGEADWIQGYFTMIDRATVITTNNKILRMINVMGILHIQMKHSQTSFDYWLCYKLAFSCQTTKVNIVRNL